MTATRITALTLGLLIGSLGLLADAGAQASAPVRVKVDCKGFDNVCIDKFKEAFVKATAKTKYAGRSEFFVSELEKGYARGEKSRSAKQPSFDYTFSDGVDSKRASPKVHRIHFSWGDIGGYGLGFLLFML